MYDPTMASTTDGLNANAPNLPADIGNSVALGGLDDDLLAMPQFNGSGSGLSVEQADALVQEYLNQFHSTELGGLDPWMDLSFGAEDVEPSPASADTLDSLTGLSPQAALANSQSPEMKDLGTILGAREFDGQGTSNPQNLYSFTVNSDSDLHINLEGASRSQNLWLYEVQPSSSAVSYELIRFSNGWTSEPSTINLSDQGPGQYLVRVDNSASARDYTLNLDVSPTGGIEHIQGGLTADSWEFEGDTRYTVYSGEGNVNFGQGEFDLIDFSQYTLDDVIGWNPVTPDGGGMLFDSGNGLRLFDAMQLNDGHHILFEGIDRLAFADGQVDLAVTPNDPLFDQQWNLHMTGVHNAWRFTQGSEDVLIGIQDDGLEIARVEDSNSWTGFRYDIHPDLDISRIQGTGLRFPPDILRPSHGTSVHGIVAAASNNDTGMSGINWNSDVWHSGVYQLPFRQPLPEQIIEATQTMINEGIESGRPLVINMSFSIPNLEIGDLPELESLISESQDTALFVVSAGNENKDNLNYPDRLAKIYDNVVAVGASWGAQDIAENPTTPGTRISYTEESHPDLDPNRARWGSNYGDGLSLMAPSEVIATSYVSPLRRENPSIFPKFDYSFEFNGTSAAAPHVTGIASLAWSVNPDLTASEINGIMQKTAFELGDAFEYGAGLVNADGAVRKAMALANPVSNWNALGDQPLSLASFIDQGAETPVLGVTATQFGSEPPVESVEAGDDAVANAAGEAAMPWWDRPFSLPTFDVNSPWANLDWQTPEMSISQFDWVMPEFSMPGADWVPPTTGFESASLPTVDDLTSPLIESLSEPLVEAIA